MANEESDAQQIRCFMCQGEEMDEMEDPRGLVVPEPLIVLICRNCGFVMQFANRPGGPSLQYDAS